MWWDAQETFVAFVFVLFRKQQHQGNGYCSLNSFNPQSVCYSRSVLCHTRIIGLTRINSLPMNNGRHDWFGRWTCMSAASTNVMVTLCVKNKNAFFFVWCAHFKAFVQCCVQNVVNNGSVNECMMIAQIGSKKREEGWQNSLEVPALQFRGVWSSNNFFSMMHNIHCKLWLLSSVHSRQTNHLLKAWKQWQHFLPHCYLAMETASKK